MSRPIVAFDIETTGLDKSKDHIIQFSAVKYDRDSKTVLSQYSTYIQPMGNYVISIAAFHKHNISPDKLSNMPNFIDIAEEIYDFIKDCDILGYNALKFDAPFLQEEFRQCGITWNFSECNFYDAFLEEKRRNGNSLEETFKRYKGTTMEEAGLKAHDALSDVFATIAVFEKQQETQPVNPEEIITEDGFLERMMFNHKEDICFTVGKYKGVSVEYVAKYDKGYLNWILNNNNFSAQTKAAVRVYL